VNARAALHCLAAVAVALGAAACATRADPAPLPVRLVTWNIHHGEGLDGTVDIDHIAAELLAQKPDVVCLQEVDVGVTRSRQLDIPQELAQRLGMHAAFGKNIDYQGGDYGNAILSRWPIAWQHNLHYQMLRAGEQRGLLTVGLDTGRGTFAFGCTHLDFRPDPSERLQNAGEILAAVRDRQLCAVAGDFNDHPDSALHERLSAELRDCWQQLPQRDAGATFPAGAPDRRIDWVLLAPARATATAGLVPATTASDHRPVAVTLEVCVAPPAR